MCRNGVKDDDAVSAAGLRVVQGQLRLGQQRAGSGNVEVELGDTDADRRVANATCDRGADALHRHGGLGGGRVRQEDGEQIATDAERQILGATPP